MINNFLDPIFIIPLISQLELESFLPSYLEIHKSTGYPSCWLHFVLVTPKYFVDCAHHVKSPWLKPQTIKPKLHWYLDSTHDFLHGFFPGWTPEKCPTTVTHQSSKVSIFSNPTGDEHLPNYIFFTAIQDFIQSYLQPKTDPIPKHCGIELHFNPAIVLFSHMGISINGGTPKWLVYNGKSHENGWFGATPMTLETPIFTIPFLWTARFSAEVWLVPMVLSFLRGPKNGRRCAADQAMAEGLWTFRRSDRCLQIGIATFFFFFRSVKPILY